MPDLAGERELAIFVMLRKLSAHALCRAL